MGSPARPGSSASCLLPCSKIGLTYVASADELSSFRPASGAAYELLLQFLTCFYTQRWVSYAEKKFQLNYYSYLSNLSIITDTNRMAQRIIIQEVVEFCRKLPQRGPWRSRGVANASLSVLPLENASGHNRFSSIFAGGADINIYLFKAHNDSTKKHENHPILASSVLQIAGCPSNRARCVAGCWIRHRIVCLLARL